MSSPTVKLPALCITRVNRRVTDRIIYGTMERLLGKGCIDFLEMSPRTDNRTGEFYYFVYMTFNEYTPKPLIARSPSVQPCVMYTEHGSFTTSEFQEDDPIFHRITEMLCRLDATGEVRIEYRAPYYFKLRKYVKPVRRANPVPRILPPLPPATATDVAAKAVEEAVSAAIAVVVEDGAEP